MFFGVTSVSCHRGSFQIVGACLQAIVRLFRLTGSGIACPSTPLGTLSLSNGQAGSYRCAAPKNGQAP
jgi:hypothetical protein